MKRFVVAMVLSACATTSSTTATTATAPTKPECPTTEPATTDDAQLLWTSRIVKVCVLGADAERAGPLYEMVKSREGQQLSPEWITDELRNFVATGFVRDAKAIASRAGENTAVLTFVVKQYPQVGEVKFVAGRKVDVGATRETAFKTYWASPMALARLKEELVDTLQAQGFASATVELKTTSVGEKTNVEFIITEGPQDTVTAIQFVGNKRIKEAELNKALRSALNAPWDVNTTGNDESAIQALYWDRGMLDATAKAAEVREASSGSVTVTFTISEGDVFSYGTVKVRGDAVGSEKVLLKLLESKTGKTFSRSAVRRDIAKLEARGQVNVEPEVSFDRKKKRADLTFVVTPK